MLTPCEVSARPAVVNVVSAEVRYPAESRCVRSAHSVAAPPITNPTARNASTPPMITDTVRPGVHPDPAPEPRYCGGAPGTPPVPPTGLSVTHPAAAPGEVAADCVAGVDIATAPGVPGSPGPAGPPTVSVSCGSWPPRSTRNGGYRSVIN